ncbi:acyl-CoA thioesterase [Pseudooceanicola aestuarii]|uniref:acyl-CoA thioesterase n=1 Tax=Pseudooceanicola aestuarii TaxID=2697319 RepID=UPI0013D5410E|nr:acyl-CoA thioesterase II [Pseudooceanicola aestuarii]
MTDPSPNSKLEDTLTPILDVERIEEDFYRGIATPNGRGRSFGGQVIAQALMAATHTVEPERANHSLHAYFMRPGDASQPVLYQVERDMDGRSFATRRVVAIQNGKPILNMAASFQLQQQGRGHQDDFPADVPGPEGLKNEHQLAEDHADKLPEGYKAFLRWNRPIEIRPVGTFPPFDMTPRKGEHYRWIRAKVHLPDDPALHRAALAYTSDMGLLGSALVAHGLGFASKEVKVASLDHALWLHDDFRMDEWLLYTMESPWTGGGRGMTRGKIFTRDGRMVASVAQEGLLRIG